MLPSCVLLYTVLMVGPCRPLSPGWSSSFCATCMNDKEMQLHMQDDQPVSEVCCCTGMLTFLDIQTSLVELSAQPSTAGNATDT